MTNDMSMAKAAKAAFDSSIFGRVWGVLVTSSRFGAVSGGLVLSPVVLFGWAWPGLLVAGGCVLAAVALRVQTIRDQSRSSMTGLHVQAPVLKSPNGAISMRDAVKLYGRDAKLLLLVASEGMLLAVMDTSSLERPSTTSSAASEAGRNRQRRSVRHIAQCPPTGPME